MSGDDVASIRQGLTKLYETSGLNPDVVLTTEPGGNPWGLLLAAVCNKNLAIARQADGVCNTPTLLALQRNGYRHCKLAIPKLPVGSTVLFIEDVISTGGTLKTLAAALHEQDVIALGAICIVRKQMDSFPELGFPIFSMYHDQVSISN